MCKVNIAASERRILPHVRTGRGIIVAIGQFLIAMKRVTIEQNREWACSLRLTQHTYEA